MQGDLDLIIADAHLDIRRLVFLSISDGGVVADVGALPLNADSEVGCASAEPRHDAREVRRWPTTLL